jgi:hypothetical protein
MADNVHIYVSAWRVDVRAQRGGGYMEIYRDVPGVCAAAVV